jgi:NADH-quinone oxidoreductase subunit C
MMEAHAIYEALATRLPNAIFDFAAGKDPSFKVRPERWPEVALALRDDPALAFDFLDVITAVDWMKQGRVDVVYHLFSYAHRHAITVRAELSRERPQIASVASVWRAADWQEREQFDLVGVEFLGHPELRRILLPDDWVGHPLRKDWSEPAAYRGMPTTRPSTLDLLPMYDREKKA